MATTEAIDRLLAQGWTMTIMEQSEGLSWYVAYLSNPDPDGVNYVGVQDSYDEAIKALAIDVSTGEGGRGISRGFPDD